MNSKIYIRTYEEMAKLSTFKERFDYLYLGDKIGNETFGNHRYLNQRLYTSAIWKKTRDRVIIRDYGQDLGSYGCELGRHNVIIHHINPITIEDVINMDPKIFDLNNLITCSFDTHNKIHYGGDKPGNEFIIRTPGDHCPWKNGGEKN